MRSLFLIFEQNCVCCRGYHATLKKPAEDFGQSTAFESDAQEEMKRRFRIRPRMGSFSRHNSNAAKHDLAQQEKRMELAKEKVAERKKMIQAAKEEKL